MVETFLSTLYTCESIGEVGLCNCVYEGRRDKQKVLMVVTVFEGENERFGVTIAAGSAPYHCGTAGERAPRKLNHRLSNANFVITE